MPFGFFGFFPKIFAQRNLQRSLLRLQCLSASSGFSPQSLPKGEAVQQKVSNAFRLLRVFPRLPQPLTAFLVLRRLQCLSASSGFSPKLVTEELSNLGFKSPMPFGFFGFFPKKNYLQFRHYRSVSNAFRLLRVFPQFSRVKTVDGEAASPMPFGFFGFFPSALGFNKVRISEMSPMPFGFFGFFPWATTNFHAYTGTPCLQCLSASSGFSPTKSC